jgi:hypothetical protein
VLRGTGGRRSLAWRAAPAHPQVSTVGELWDRRHCHTRPDSRSIANRMRKGGYRGEDHLWSGRFVGNAGRQHRCGRTACPGEQNGEGVNALARFCREHKASLVVMEASGGYEQLVFALLWKKKVACAIVNARAVRWFAESMGKLEKTDRIDAGMIAEYAAAKPSWRNSQPARRSSGSAPW